jgi:hypothetical protein
MGFVKSSTKRSSRHQNSHSCLSSTSQSEARNLTRGVLFMTMLSLTKLFSSPKLMQCQMSDCQWWLWEDMISLLSSFKVGHYSAIRQNRLTKTTKSPNQGSRSSGRDSNTKPNEYKTCTITNIPQRWFQRWGSGKAGKHNKNTHKKHL